MRGQGCGLGPLLAMFSRAEHGYWLDLQALDGDRLQAGDRVCVGLPEGQLVKSVSLAYVLPMLGILVGAWSAAVLYPELGDLSAVAGALAGMVMGWAGLALSRNRRQVTLIH